MAGGRSAPFVGEKEGFGSESVIKVPVVLTSSDPVVPCLPGNEIHKEYNLPTHILKTCILKWGR